MKNNTGNTNTLEKFCPSVTLFTVNPRHAALKAVPTLRDAKSVNSNLRYGTATPSASTVSFFLLLFSLQ